MIFVRPYLLPFITNIEEEYVATGIGGVVVRVSTVGEGEGIHVFVPMILGK